MASDRPNQPVKYPGLLWQVILPGNSPLRLQKPVFINSVLPVGGNYCALILEFADTYLKSTTT